MPPPPSGSGSPRTLSTRCSFDVDSAPVGERMKPVLRYVGKLTPNPSQMTPADSRGDPRPEGRSRRCSRKML
jgi:hypothetical protein